MTERMFQLHLGDCLEVLRTMPADSVDSIVTDPPYGLSDQRVDELILRMNAWLAGEVYNREGKGFMGNSWDSWVPGPEVWRECYRVLKPGGHILAFAGTRTQHLMAMSIALAGFEIRDMIAWVYGSGFPKSRNLGGEWEGWGTALKPALEPITVARKPLVGTVAANVLAHGTGALNIDACRIETTESLNGGAYAKEGGRCESQSLHGGTGMNVAGKTVGKDFEQPTGRWPANLIHDGSEEAAAFPAAPGALAAVTGGEPSSSTLNTYGKFKRSASDRTGEASANSENFGAVGFKMKPVARREAADSAARFFYCAKASREDRNEGVGGSAEPAVTTNATMREREDANWSARNGNYHPTVKPTDLMAYLCRLVTPPGGTVLDPFMGSGSTGKAAVLEGFSFIGIEREADYFAIARARIDFAKRRGHQPSLLDLL